MLMNCRYRKSFSLGLMFLLILLPHLALAARPVEYGGNDDLDACLSLGYVDHLNQGPDGFLAVKDEPKLSAKRIDKVYNGQTVYICAETKDGLWLGIVYTKDEKIDCGTTSPVDKRKPYKGPCKSGWVSKKWIVIEAG